MSAPPAPRGADSVPEDGLGDSRALEPRTIRHGACGKSWTGLTNGHCGQCHETFSRGAFDRHQRISRGVITCSTAGLEQRAKPWGTLWTTSGGYWGTPVAETAYADGPTAVDLADAAEPPEAPRGALSAPGGPSAPAAGPRLATGPSQRPHHWATGNRTSRLPANWGQIRARIWKRDNGQCQHHENGITCLQPARDVDHRIHGNDHRDENLRCLCGPHHDTKTQAEAYAARVSLFRAPEAHPGLLPPTERRP